jgi:hypothetical protein
VNGSPVGTDASIFSTNTLTASIETLDVGHVTVNTLQYLKHDIIIQGFSRTRFGNTFYFTRTGDIGTDVQITIEYEYRDDIIGYTQSAFPNITIYAVDKSLDQQIRRAANKVDKTSVSTDIETRMTALQNADVMVHNKTKNTWYSISKVSAASFPPQLGLPPRYAWTQYTFKDLQTGQPANYNDVFVIGDTFTFHQSTMVFDEYDRMYDSSNTKLLSLSNTYRPTGFPYEHTLKGFRTTGDEHVRIAEKIDLVFDYQLIHNTTDEYLQHGVVGPRIQVCLEKRYEKGIDFAVVSDSTSGVSTWRSQDLMRSDAHVHGSWYLKYTDKTGGGIFDQYIQLVDPDPLLSTALVKETETPESGGSVRIFHIPDLEDSIYNNTFKPGNTYTFDIFNNQGVEYMTPRDYVSIESVDIKVREGRGFTSDSPAEMTTWTSIEQVMPFLSAENVNTAHYQFLQGLGISMLDISTHQHTFDSYTVSYDYYNNKKIVLTSPTRSYFDMDEFTIVIPTRIEPSQRVCAVFKMDEKDVENAGDLLYDVDMTLDSPITVRAVPYERIGHLYTTFDDTLNTLDVFLNMWWNSPDGTHIGGDANVSKIIVSFTENFTATSVSHVQGYSSSIETNGDIVITPSTPAVIPPTSESNHVKIASIVGTHTAYPNLFGATLHLDNDKTIQNYSEISPGRKAIFDRYEQYYTSGSEVEKVLVTQQFDENVYPDGIRARVTFTKHRKASGSKMYSYIKMCIACETYIGHIMSVSIPLTPVIGYRYDGTNATVYTKESEVEPHIDCVIKAVWSYNEPKFKIITSDTIKNILSVSDAFGIHTVTYTGRYDTPLADLEKNVFFKRLIVYDTSHGKAVARLSFTTIEGFEENTTTGEWKKTSDVAHIVIDYEGTYKSTFLLDKSNPAYLSFNTSVWTSFRGFTFSYWMKPTISAQTTDDTGTNEGDQTTDTIEYHAILVNVNMNIGIINENLFIEDSSTGEKFILKQLYMNSWTHVAITYTPGESINDASTWKVFVGGTHTYTLPDQFEIVESRVLFGYPMGDYSVGKMWIDDIAFFSSPLSFADVQTLATSNKSAFTIVSEDTTGTYESYYASFNAESMISNGMRIDVIDGTGQWDPIFSYLPRYLDIY